MERAWTLRAGGEADVRAMYMLDLLCFDEPFRFNLRAMCRFVLQPGAISVVAEAAGQLAGFVVVHLLRRRRGMTGYVVTLDVAAEFRRHGLAGALMDAAERVALEARATEMMLHVHTENAGAVRFYEGRGYGRTAECADFYREGLHAWVFRRVFEAERFS